MASAEDTPAAASAPAALPGIYFTAYGVSINETFKKEKPAPANGRLVLFSGMEDTNAMKLIILATTDAHWQILKVEDPILIDAQTASGEALLAPRSMEGNNISFRMFDGGFTPQGRQPAYVNLDLASPRYPTTSLRTLVATVNLILAKDDAIKTSKIKITTDESDPPDADGCDLTFTRIDDKVKVNFTSGVFAFVKSITFLDATGAVCTGQEVGQSIGSKSSMTLQFRGKVPATVVLEYFSDTHHLQTTMRLQSFPLLGIGSARDLEQHPAESVHEVLKPVAKEPDALEARPAPAHVANPVVPAKPATTTP